MQSGGIVTVPVECCRRPYRSRSSTSATLIFRQGERDDTDGIAIVGEQHATWSSWHG
jgi:hypothetical protein